jgi:uncharacterized protein (DUF1919 family)
VIESYGSARDNGTLPIVVHVFTPCHSYYLLFGIYYTKVKHYFCDIPYYFYLYPLTHYADRGILTVDYDRIGEKKMTTQERKVRINREMQQVIMEAMADCESRGITKPYDIALCIRHDILSAFRVFLNTK